ncbi:hypothetical protein MP638_001400 [Amoeboaphelidium occidentale]|nr:hypothetical protein MP638_001400 [Amoeboaphelidium occidentale]
MRLTQDVEIKGLSFVSKSGLMVDKAYKVDYLELQMVNVPIVCVIDQEILKTTRKCSPVFETDYTLEKLVGVGARLVFGPLSVSWKDKDKKKQSTRVELDLTHFEKLCVYMFMNSNNGLPASELEQIKSLANHCAFVLSKMLSINADELAKKGFNEKQITAKNIVAILVDLETKEVVGYGIKSLSDNHEHAEMNLLRKIEFTEETKAGKSFMLLSSLQPCRMCFGTISHRGIAYCFYLKADPKAIFSFDTGFPQRTFGGLLDSCDSPTRTLSDEDNLSLGTFQSEVRSNLESNPTLLHKGKEAEEQMKNIFIIVLILFIFTIVSVRAIPNPMEGDLQLDDEDKKMMSRKTTAARKTMIKYSGDSEAKQYKLLKVFLSKTEDESPLLLNYNLQQQDSLLILLLQSMSHSITLQYYFPSLPSITPTVSGKDLQKRLNDLLLKSFYEDNKSFKESLYSIISSSELTSASNGKNVLCVLNFLLILHKNGMTSFLKEEDSTSIVNVLKEYFDYVISNFLVTSSTSSSTSSNDYDSTTTFNYDDFHNVLFSTNQTTSTNSSSTSSTPSSFVVYYIIHEYFDYVISNFLVTSSTSSSTSSTSNDYDSTTTFNYDDFHNVLFSTNQTTTTSTSSSSSSFVVYYIIHVLTLILPSQLTLTSALIHRLKNSHPIELSFVMSSFKISSVSKDSEDLVYLRNISSSDDFITTDVHDHDDDDDDDMVEYVYDDSTASASLPSSTNNNITTTTTTTSSTLNKKDKNWFSTLLSLKGGSGSSVNRTLKSLSLSSHSASNSDYSYNSGGSGDASAGMAASAASAAAALEDSYNGFTMTKDQLFCFIKHLQQKSNCSAAAAAASASSEKEFKWFTFRGRLMGVCGSLLKVYSLGGNLEFQIDYYEKGSTENMKVDAATKISNTASMVSSGLRVPTINGNLLSPQSAHSRKASSVSVVAEEELENEDSLPKLQDLLDEGEKEKEEDVNVAFFQDKTPRNPLKSRLSLKSMEKKKSYSEAAECFLNDLSLFTNSSNPDKDFPDGCQNISSDPKKLKQFLEFLDYFPCTKEYLTCTLVTSQFILEMSRHTCNYEKCLKSDKYGFIRSVVESFRRPKASKDSGFIGGYKMLSNHDDIALFKVVQDEYELCLTSDKYGFIRSVVESFRRPKASKDNVFIGGYKMLSNHDDIALFKVVQDEYELVFHTPLESFTGNSLQSVSEDELLQNLKTISQDDLVHLLYVDSEEYGKEKDAFELIRMYQRLYSSNTTETVNGLVYILLYPLPCQMVRLRLVLNTRNYKGLFSNVSQLFSTIHDGMILSREWLQLVLPLAVYEVHTFLLKRIKRFSNCASSPAVQKTDKSHGPLVFSRSANSLFSSTTTAAIRKQPYPVQTEITIQSLSSTKELPPLPRERVPYNPHPETRHGDVYTQRRDLLMALSRMG